MREHRIGLGLRVYRSRVKIDCKRVSSVGCHFFGLSQNKQMAQCECFDYLFLGFPLITQLGDKSCVGDRS